MREDDAIYVLGGAALGWVISRAIQAEGRGAWPVGPLSGLGRRMGQFPVPPQPPPLPYSEQFTVEDILAAQNEIGELKGELSELDGEIADAGEHVDRLESEGATVEQLREANGELNDLMARRESVQREIQETEILIEREMRARAEFDERVRRREEEEQEDLERRRAEFERWSRLTEEEREAEFLRWWAEKQAEILRGEIERQREVPGRPLYPWLPPGEYFGEPPEPLLPPSPTGFWPQPVPAPPTAPGAVPTGTRIPLAPAPQPVATPSAFGPRPAPVPTAAVAPSPQAVPSEDWRTGGCPPGRVRMHPGGACVLPGALQAGLTMAPTAVPAGGDAGVPAATPSTPTSVSAAPAVASVGARLLKSGPALALSRRMRSGGW